MTAKNTQGEHDPADAPAGVLYPPMPAIGIIEEVKDFDPRKDLLATRNVRATVANFLGSRGPNLDMKELMALSSLLKDIDAAALGQMRIAAEEKTADINEQNRQAVLAVLGHLTAVKNAGQTLVPGAQRTEPPTLPDGIETREFVPGESTQGTVLQTFEQFQKERIGEIALTGDDSVD